MELQVETSKYHYYLIVVRDQKRDVIEWIKWSGLRFELACKYKWYFHYRACLLQVKYPKHIVEENWGNEESPEQQQERSLRNAEISKKAQYTKWINKKNKFVSEYNELLPIEEHPIYDHIIKKIREYQPNTNW